MVAKNGIYKTTTRNEDIKRKRDAFVRKKLLGCREKWGVDLKDLDRRSRLNISEICGTWRERMPLDCSAVIVDDIQD